MKNKKLTSLCLALLIAAMLCISAFAAPSITYNGRSSGVAYAPGSVYTDTDLFGGIKMLMPGDSVTETITVKNYCSTCAYVNVYLRTLPHDADGNPITPDVLTRLTADERRETLDTVSYMRDFLKNITITVTGEEGQIFKGNVISFEDALKDEAAFIGRLTFNKTTELEVKLDVDIELGNEFANRIGELDFVLVFEERAKIPVKPTTTERTTASEPEETSVPATSEPEVTTNEPPVTVTGDITTDVPPEETTTPDVTEEPPVSSGDGTTASEPVETEEITVDTSDVSETTKPHKPSDSPQTGDNTRIFLYVWLFLIALLILVAIVVTELKKRKR